ncbi:YdcF family protein [Bosea sp. (in: a-proteobacteria)]|uniref:YdcF family protein n=1 Tax=Bosea sp. (in: a-proteobacteria) TaxID=1871050 RepID=UPI002FC9D08B
MFFVLSKVIWFFASPVNLAIAGLALASLLAFTRFARPARWLGLFCITVLVALAFSPLPRILVRPLEDRFPQQAVNSGKVDGIIVLGGAIGVAREDIVLNNAAARMTKAVELARAHPEAKLVFTGGGANLLSPVIRTEADGARLLFLGLGLPESRLVLEDQSRNTIENAVFTRRLVDPKPGERWLLVTSAWHMPRAMGVFRQAGFAVEAFPVDFLSSGERADFFRPYRKAARGLDIADDAFKEWVGLVAYYLAGYSDALFPGPEQVAGRQ